MGGSQQDPHSAHLGHASSTTHPADVAPPTGVAPGPEPGGPFRHATADSHIPRPKYEVPQEDLPAQADDVTTSAESANLGEKYTPGSAPGGPAPLATNFKPARGK